MSDRAEFIRLRRKAARVHRVLMRVLGSPVLRKRRARPLDMLIATILSQNTNDVNSHRAYVRLREVYPRWEDVRTASVSSVASAIRAAGMAKQRAASIKQVLETVEKTFGRLDLRALRTYSDEEIFSLLLPLKGIGPKTVACVLAFSLGRDVFPVDTHVHRICGRLGLASGTPSPEKTFERMKQIVPRGKAYALHVNMIKFGRAICRAQQPICGACPLYDECSFKEKKSFRSGQGHARITTAHEFLLMDHI